jgi:hypothetical protein
LGEGGGGRNGERPRWFTGRSLLLLPYQLLAIPVEKTSSLIRDDEGNNIDLDPWVDREVLASLSNEHPGVKGPRAILAESVVWNTRSPHSSLPVRKAKEYSLLLVRLVFDLYNKIGDPVSVEISG